MTYLQFLRLQKGITQKALAEALGVSPTALCRVERGWLARCPMELEEKLTAFFGPEWSFQKLMETPPEPRPDGA
ncbi:MAG: helix-turn-helix domain-containing protein [Desulfomonilaceae bacterium]